MAGLEFHITADNRDFLNKVRQVQEKATETVQKVEKEGNELDEVFKKLGSGIAALGAGFTATKLVSDIVRVRGEFQQLEIAMETMLGSKAKADALMAQLVSTAAKTPFGLTDIAQGAKQLLAYGTASEEVNETLVRLGNIASGLSIPLNDLVYLYGTTMTQGRLFTQDLRQFMGRGIPLADELAKQFGVTKDKVGELVTEGKVGFPEVEKAINALTNEGGKFYNLMEKQSSSLTGQISNLEDAWDMMLNEIGTKTQGLASGAIQAASSLIENYEKVGRIIVEIAGVYGTYRAALVAATATQRVNTLVMEEAAVQIQLAAMRHEALTVAQAKAIARTNLLTLAKQKLMATMKGLGKTLTNPYVLAAAAVTALGFGIYKLITYQTEAEKAQNRLNDAFAEASSSAGSEIKQLDELKGRLSAAKKGSAEYYEIKDEIVKNFGKYDSTLADEIERVGDLSTTYDRLTAAIQNSANARMYDKYVEEETERYDKDVTAKLKKLQETIYGKDGISTEDAARAYSKIWKNIFQGEALDEETQRVIDSFNEIKYVSTGYGTSMSYNVNAVEGYISGLKDLNTQQDIFINNARDMFGFGADTSDFNKGLKNLTEDQLNQTKKDLDEVLKKFKDTKQEQAYSLVSGEDITFATEQQINDAINNVDAYLEQIKAQRDKNKPKEEEIEEKAIKKAEQAAEKVADASRKAEFNLKKAQTDDEIKLIEIERDAKIKALNDELEAYKAIYEAAGKDTKQLEESFARMIEVEKKMADIEIDEANTKKSDKIKKELNDLLNEFETYQQAVARVEKDYEEKRKKMYEDDGKTFKTGFGQDNITELERQKKEAIAEIADNYADKSEAYRKWADSLSSIAITELNKMLALAKARLQILKDSDGADELTIAQLEAAIDSLDTAASNAGKTTKDSTVNWTELNGVLKDCSGIFSELGEKVPGVAGDMLKGFGEISSGVLGVANGIHAVDDAIGALEKASAILAVISAAIKVVDYFTGVAEKNKQANLEAAKAADEYALALEDIESKRAVESHSNIFGDDPWAKFRENVDITREKLALLNEEMKKSAGFDVVNFKINSSGWSSFSKDFNAKMKEIEELGDGALVSDMRTSWQKLWGTGNDNLKVVSLQDFMDEEGFLDTDKLEAWYKAYGEGLSEEQDNLVSYLLESWKSYYDSMEEMEVYLEGMMGDTAGLIAERWIESFYETGSAITDLSKISGDFARSFAKDMLKNILMTQVFNEEAQKNMFDLLKAGDVEGATKYYDKLVEDAEKLGETANAVFESLGITASDIEDGPERTPATKSGITASQESVDESNGRLTAIQSHTYSINEECKRMASYGAQIVSRLTAIERNTGYLSSISSNIAAISSDIEVIKNRGVTML